MGEVIDITQRIPVDVPEQLRVVPGWVCWRREQFAGEAKPRKVPYYVNGTRRHGMQGSPQDRANLATFETARAAAIKYGFDGVGLAMLPDWGITALDFDKCIDANGKLIGELVPIAGMTYSEVSPSGTGLRAFVLGNLGDRKDIAAPGRYGVEVFSSKGFVTVTGNVTDFCDIVGNEDKICEPSPELLDLLECRFGASSGATFDTGDFMAGYEPKVGLTNIQMKELLSYLDPNMPREQWLRVGLALNHETEGDDDGFEIWNEWSMGGATYPDTEALRYQWESFRGPQPGKRLVTMASVIKMAQKAGYILSRSMEPELEVKATAALISATPYEWRAPMLIPPRPWIFGHWLLAGTVACVVAPGGVGKSTFVAALALSCATGEAFLSKRVWGGPKNVWLWNLEDDLDELSRTIQATCIRHDIKHDVIADRLFVNSGMDGSPLCTATEDREGMKLLEPVYEALVTEIQRRGIKVLIIDPFVSSHSVEENSNSKIDKIAKAWGRVAKAAGCVVILVHHTSKAGSGEVNANSARGASALTSAARSVLTLNRLTAQDAEKYGIPEDKRRRYFAVLDDKHNRAPAENDAWFELVSVELGNGDSVAACVPWRLPDMAVELTTAEICAIQKMIDEGHYRDHLTAKDWVGSAIAAVLSLSLQVGEEKARVKGVQKDLKERGYLKVEHIRNEKGKEIPYTVSGIRPVMDEEF